MRKLLFTVSILIYFVSNAERYKEQINFYASGDQTVALGRYQIGAAVRVECKITGGWAEDGGIFHIVSDWGHTPTVTLRSEGDISNRLNFYGYVDPTSNSYAYLFATWDNVSPDESYANDIKFTIFSESQFDVNNTGSFSSAVELETVLGIQARTKNVGIGTTNPSNKLEVNGTIRSKEVKVEASPWPDYVFEPDYDLKSLEEIEAYIKAEKHLPEIPSAKEMETDGVQLGEMNMLLLKKIEELTLHTIAQEKKINELEPYPSLLKEREAKQGELEKKIEELMLYLIQNEKEKEELRQQLKANSQSKETEGRSGELEKKIEELALYQIDLLKRLDKQQEINSKLINRIEKLEKDQ